MCYHTHNLSDHLATFIHYVHSWFHTVERDDRGFYYGCKAKFDGIQSGTPPFRSDDPTFNSLIQGLLSLTKEHYQTIDFVDMKKYEPTLSSRRIESTGRRPGTASQNIDDPRMKFRSRGKTGQTLQSLQAAPSTNRPLLNEHAALASLLIHYLNNPSEGVAQVPNQFKALPNVTFNYGTKNVIGVDTFRVRSW